MRLKYKHIAVDFDGTIAGEEHFPKVGKELPNAIRVLNKIVEHGGILSIWTCRSGCDLDFAISWMNKNGLKYTYVNQDFPDIAKDYIGFTRKICADLYIDNKDIHCIGNGGINWDWIEQQIFESE